MKHPVMARFFAVVLAVMSLISTAVGVGGFSDTAKEKQEADAYSVRLSEKKNTYAEISAELENEKSYSEANAELKEMREEHDGDAAQHRTDVATYSATKGGYTMGANALWEAKVQVDGAKQEFLMQKQQMLAQLRAMDAMKASMQGAINSLNGASAGCKNSINTIAAVGSMPAEPPAAENPGEAPTPVEMPEQEQPVYNPPAVPAAPEEPGEEASEEETAQYNELKAAYDAAYEAKNAYDEEYNTELTAYNEAMAPYNDYVAKKASYDSALAAYNDYEAYPAQIAAWQANAGAAMMSAAGALTTAGSAISGAMAALPDEYKSMIPAGGGASVDVTALMSMPPEAALQVLTGVLNETSSGLDQFSGALQSGLETINSKIASSMGGGDMGISIPANADADTIVGIIEKAINDGVGQVQGGLEMIWWNLGELEKDKEELAEEKTVLDDEAAILGEMEEKTDELKNLEKKMKSSRAILMNVARIKEQVENGGELVESAEVYLEEYRQESERHTNTSYAICILAIAAGIAGLAGIPAAYEKIRNRVFLIAPPAICVICAAVGTYLGMTDGTNAQYYVAMFTAIIALMHLLIVLPKNKVIV